MQKKKKKFIIGSLLIVCAIVYLVITGISKTSVYYLTVSELLAKGDAIYNESVRVEGKVVNGSVKYLSPMKVDFKIRDDDKEIAAYYEGIIPDMFKDEAKVVLEGKFSSTGVFKAKTLMTSCPSKYEAEK